MAQEYTVTVYKYLTGVAFKTSVDIMDVQFMSVEYGKDGKEVRREEKSVSVAQESFSGNWTNADICKSLNLDGVMVTDKDTELLTFRLLA